MQQYRLTLETPFWMPGPSQLQRLGLLTSSNSALLLKSSDVLLPEPVIHLSQRALSPCAKAPSWRGAVSVSGLWVLIASEHGRAARDDRADAELVCAVAAALRSWRESTGNVPASKILREAVWFYWQFPRLERPIVPPKYPRAIPWSEDAARIVLRGERRGGRLVIEHMEPLNRTLRWLIDDAPDPDEVVAGLPGRLECVVVTKEQSARLPDAGTREERYAQAGMSLATFRPLDDWRV